MTYEIKNLLARRLVLEVVEIKENEIVTAADYKPEFCNPYGMAHGGFLHTLAHLTSLIAGEICVGGIWEAADVSCQYLRSLRQFPVKTLVRRIGFDDCAPVFAAEVCDAKGAVCYTQTMSLRRPEPVGDPVCHTPKITNPSPMPKDPDAEPPFPCYTTAFSRMLNCYSIRRQGTGLVYALDLNDVNCDEYGMVYPPAVFTLADSAVGGSLVRIEKKNPITVSASMRFLRRSAAGLVEAIPRLTRGGRSLYYYDVDVVDGNGQCVAFAQFVIQKLE